MDKETVNLHMRVFDEHVCAYKWEQKAQFFAEW